MKVMMMLPAMILFACCGPSKKSTSGKSETLTTDMDAIESIRVRHNDEPYDGRMLTQDEITIFVAAVEKAVYNTVRNDSGIKFKMVAPDYSFLISYKPSSGRLPEGLSVWNGGNGGLVLFRTLWYNIQRDEMAVLQRLADRDS